MVLLELHKEWLLKLVVWLLYYFLQAERKDSISALVLTKAIFLPTFNAYLSFSLPVDPRIIPST